MIENALEEYGLNKNEIKVFLSLTSLGGAFAKDIIEKTKFHKNIVYDNIYKLIDKGLVSETIIENKKFFSCESPEIIEEYFTSKLNNLTKHKKEIEKLKDEIKNKKIGLPLKTQTRMFSGIEGIKQILRFELEIGKDINVIGAPIEAIELLGKAFWKNFDTKQKSKKMKGKLIFNSSLKEYAKTLSKGLNQIRFLESQIEPLTEIVIFDKYVATIVWSKEPIGTLIESKEVAQSYLDYFNLLWEKSKT